MIIINATGDEGRLKDDDATRITVNIYLGPLLIFKVAAPMMSSACQKLRKIRLESSLGVLGYRVEGEDASSQKHCLTKVDGAGPTTSETSIEINITRLISLY